MTEVSIIFLCFTMALFGLSVFVISQQHRQYAHDRELWQTERKDLLDRIQAPSFAEYTAKVIREKKAEKPQEEEKPVEFIS